MYSFDPAVGVGSLRLEACGLRNPYGIGLDLFHSGMLFSTDNGADTRGVAGETGVPVKEDREIVECRPLDEGFDALHMLRTGGQDEFFGSPETTSTTQTLVRYCRSPTKNFANSGSPARPSAGCKLPQRPDGGARVR